MPQLRGVVGGLLAGAAAAFVVGFLVRLLRRQPSAGPVAVAVLPAATSRGRHG